MYRKACSRILAQASPKWLRRMLGGKSVVLMYHELADDEMDIEAWTVVRKSDFVRQVEHLREHFDIVSLEDAVARHQAGGKIQRPLATITFDDGDSGNASVLLPLVQELKVPVTVFVATRQVAEQENFWFDRVVNALQTTEPLTLNLEKYGIGSFEINRSRGPRNWAQIDRLLTQLKRKPAGLREKLVEELVESTSHKIVNPPRRITPLSREGLAALAASRYVTIGAHSHSHQILTQLDDAEIERDVAMSKDLLESWTGKAIQSFAYPNGDCDPRVANIVRKAGFRCAVIAGDRLWGRRASVYEIPRIGVGRYDSLDRFKRNLPA